MWIATEKGWFSIVKEHDSELILVRARKKNDLKLLFPGKKIIRNKSKDYVYRVKVRRSEIVSKMVDLFLELDYTNFKDHIGDLKSQKDKLPSYSRIWSIMNDYQGDFVKGLYNYSEEDLIANYYRKLEEEGKT